MTTQQPLALCFGFHLNSHYERDHSLCKLAAADRLYLSPKTVLDLSKDVVLEPSLDHDPTHTQAKVSLQYGLGNFLLKLL